MTDHFCCTARTGVHVFHTEPQQAPKGKNKNKETKATVLYTHCIQSQCLPTSRTSTATKCSVPCLQNNSASSCWRVTCVVLFCTKVHALSCPSLLCLDIVGKFRFACPCSAASWTHRPKNSGISFLVSSLYSFSLTLSLLGFQSLFSVFCLSLDGILPAS